MAAAALIGESGAASAASSSNLVFRGAAQSCAELAGDTAIALDASGEALFVAGPDFLFAFAGNPSRRVHEWNPVRQLVRISADGMRPVWLRCSDLKAMPIACTTLRLRPLGDGKIEVGQPVGGVRALDEEAAGMPDARGIPACPGDPRCPRPGG
jgi:hypothetical protein